MSIDEAGCGSIITGMGVPMFDVPGVFPSPVAGGTPGTPIRSPVRGKQYVVSIPTANALEHRLVSSQEISTITGVLSRVMANAILRDPTAGPAYNTLRYAVLSGGMKITPEVKKPVIAEGQETPPDPPDLKLSTEIAEFCVRAVNRLERHIILVLAELLDALPFRNKVAERVEELVTTGPDSGRWSLRRIATKPHWSYSFVVDSKGTLVALRCLTDIDGKLEWRDIAPSAFVIAQWDAKDGNPQGNSILEAAEQAFILKCRLTQNWWKGLKQFGTPSLFGTTHEGAEEVLQRNDDGSVAVDENGDPLPGINPQVSMKSGLEDFQSGSVIVGPYGSDIKVIESNKDATGVEKSLERCDRDLTRSILLQVRATMESRFGSKADSQTGQDILGVFVQFIRLWLCSIVDRDILFPIVEVNWGTEIANRLTPKVSLGAISPADFVSASNAIAALFQSGYLTEDQLMELDAMLNLPVRAPGAKRVGPQQKLEAQQNSGGQSDGQPNQNQDPNGQPSNGASQ